LKPREFTSPFFRGAYNFLLFQIFLSLAGCNPSFYQPLDYTTFFKPPLILCFGSPSLDLPPTPPYKLPLFYFSSPLCPFGDPFPPSFPALHLFNQNVCVLYNRGSARAKTREISFSISPPLPSHPSPLSPPPPPPLLLWLFLRRLGVCFFWRVLLPCQVPSVSCELPVSPRLDFLPRTFFRPYFARHVRPL